MGEQSQASARRPGIARKAVRVLSILMTWAVGEGQLEANPLIGKHPALG